MCKRTKFAKRKRGKQLKNLFCEVLRGDEQPQHQSVCGTGQPLCFLGRSKEEVRLHDLLFRDLIKHLRHKQSGRLGSPRFRRSGAVCGATACKLLLRSLGSSSGRYFESVLRRKATRLSVGLMPASRSLSTRALIAGYTLNTATRIPMMEPMADNTICQVVVPATVTVTITAVGVTVPSGQLCEGEQGRQVDTDVWPKERMRISCGTQSARETAGSVACNYTIEKP